VIDGLDELGLRENTIVFYIWGDNGSSAEGQNGSISELLAQNQIPNTVQQQIETLNTIGGLAALGGPKVDNMYHAGWAWAGSTPLRWQGDVACGRCGTRPDLRTVTYGTHRTDARRIRTKSTTGRYSPHADGDGNAGEQHRAGA